MESVPKHGNSNRRPFSPKWQVQVSRGALAAPRHMGVSKCEVEKSFSVTSDCSLSLYYGKTQNFSSVKYPPMSRTSQSYECCRMLQTAGLTRDRVDLQRADRFHTLGTIWSIPIFHLTVLFWLAFMAGQTSQSSFFNAEMPNFQKYWKWSQQI